MIKINIKRYIKYFIWVCVLLLPRIFIAIRQNPIRLSDEVGTLAATAYLSGRDWSDIWGIVSYYGTGYHVLFTPLFRMIENPYIIYRIILLSYVLLEAGVGIIVFVIVKKYLPMIEEEHGLYISVIISYLQHNKATWISNESVIVFICWIVIYLVLKLFENIDCKKKKNFYTVLLFLILSYSLTVHIRMAIIFVGVGGVTIYIYYCKRKLLFNPVIGTVVTIIGVQCALKYNEWIQNLVWMQYRQGEYLHNATMSGNVRKILNLIKIFDRDYFITFCNIVIGQLSTASVMSFGLFVLGTIMCTIVVYETILEKNRNHPKKDYKMCVGIISIFGLICNYSTLGAQAIMWLELAKETIDKSKVTTFVDASNNYSRVFVYMRYFAPYMGTIIFVACVSLIMNKNIKQIYKISVLIVLLGQFYWLEYVLPILKNNITTATVYIPFSFSKYSQECNVDVYLPASLILVMIIGIFGVLIYRNKLKIILIIVLVGSLYQYLYYGYVHENEWHNRADSGYKLIHEMEKYTDLENCIYVPYQAMAYTYQFMLNKHRINMKLPSDDVKQALLFTNKYVLGDNDYRYNEYITDKGYKSYKLDWNEFVYVKGEELVEIMEKIVY